MYSIIIIHGYYPSILSIDIIQRHYPWVRSMDHIHRHYPWDPMEGTMGSQGWYHGCPIGRIPKPPGLQGTLGPLGPQGFIGPQGLLAPQGTQGSGSMAWMRRSTRLRSANNAPSRAGSIPPTREGENSSPTWPAPPPHQKHLRF